MTKPTVHIYCDESGHLEHDLASVMVLGAVWLPAEKVREVAVRLREIKQRHGIPPWFELKWNAVSPSKAAFYLDILDYFFDDDDLHFRAIIVPDKSKLRHEEFGQDHNTFYYKTYYNLLKLLLDEEHEFRIFLDYKDTHGAERERKLHDVLCNSIYDFDRKIIKSIQSVRSHEVEQVQLADLLTGIVSGANRGDLTSEAKKQLIARMRKRSGLMLRSSTLLRAEKVNLFRWQARETPNV